MSKIKNIYCFGTSFTKGGGFEFDINSEKSLFDIYSNLGEIPTQFNFSYPGQLQNLLTNVDLDITVHNFAKSGYGNERIYRIIWDLFNDKNFDVESTLFIIEFSDIGRKEYYYTPLKDFIICNSHVDNDKLIFHGASHTYHSTEHKKYNELIDQNLYELENFTNESIELVNQIKLALYNTHKLLGFLINNKSNIICTQPPQCWGPPDSYQEKYHKYQLFDEYGYGILQYIRDNPSQVITNETGGSYVDGHGGIVFSKTISSLLYNKMIDMKYIDKPHNILDFEKINNLKNDILKNIKSLDTI